MDQIFIRNREIATKEYVDDSIAAIDTGGDAGVPEELSMLNYNIEVTDLSRMNDDLYKLTDEDKQKFSDFVNMLTTKDKVQVVLYLSGKGSGSQTSGTTLKNIKQIYVFSMFSGSSSSTGSPIRLYGQCPTTDFNTYLANNGYPGFGLAGMVKLEIVGTWSDDIFTCTSVELNTQTGQFLKTNASAAENAAFNYFPTQRSQPVHKEYVDNVVKYYTEYPLSNNIIDFKNIKYEDIVTNAITGSSTILTNYYVYKLPEWSRYVNTNGYISINTEYLNNYTAFEKGTMQVYISSRYDINVGDSYEMKAIADYNNDPGFVNSYIPAGSTYSQKSQYIYLIVSKTTTKEQFEELQQNSNIMINFGTTALPYEPYCDSSDIATKDYVNNLISTAITDALGGEY